MITLAFGIGVALVAIAVILVQLNSIHKSITDISMSNLERDHLLKQLLSNQQAQEELNKITIMAISDLQDRVKSEDRAIIFGQKMGEA
jgi:hypothetical protein